MYVPIEKEVMKIDKDGKENVVTISYKPKFINSARFVAGSLSNRVNNFSEGIRRVKCKYGNGIKYKYRLFSWIHKL